MSTQNIIQQILALISSGTAYNGQGEMGMMGHKANMYNYQAPMMDMVKTYLFPHMKKQAPSGMQPGDFASVMEQSLLRSNLQEQINAKNHEAQMTARVAMTTMFPKKGMDYFKTLAKNPFGNIAINMLHSTIFGESATVQQAKAASKAYKYFSGTSFSRGANDMSSPMFGMSAKESVRLSSGLYGLAYRDQAGLKKRDEAFGVKEMADIAMLGQKYGANAKNVKSIVSQTKNISKMVKVGMEVYGTMDKEGVFKSIMELTRGSVNVGAGSVQIESMLQKINAMARGANIGIKVMQKIASESASIFDQMGLGPARGAIVGTEITSASRNLAPHISNKNLTQAGGLNGIRKQMMTDRFSLEKSTNLNDISFIDANLKYIYSGDKLKGKLAENLKLLKTGGKINYKDYMNIEADKKNRLYQSYRSKGYSHSKALFRATNEMSGLMGLAKSEAQEKFTEKYLRKGQGVYDTARLVSMTELQAAGNMSTEEANKILDGVKIGDEASINSYKRFTSAYDRRYRGLNENQIRAKYSSRLAVLSVTDKQRAEIKRRESKLELIAFNNSVKKKTPQGGIMDFFKSKLAQDNIFGDKWASILQVVGGGDLITSGTSIEEKTEAQLSIMAGRLVGVSQADVAKQHIDFNSSDAVKTQYSYGKYLLGRGGFARNKKSARDGQVYALGEGGFITQAQKMDFSKKESLDAIKKSILGNAKWHADKWNVGRLSKKGMGRFLQNRDLTLGNVFDYIRTGGEYMKKRTDKELLENPEAMRLYKFAIENFSGGDRRQAAKKNYDDVFSTNAYKKYNKAEMENVLGEEAYQKLIEDTKDPKLTAKQQTARQIKVYKLLLAKRTRDKRELGIKYDIAGKAAAMSAVEDKSPITLDNLLDAAEKLGIDTFDLGEDEETKKTEILSRTGDYLESVQSHVKNRKKFNKAIYSGSGAKYKPKNAADHGSKVKAYGILSRYQTLNSGEDHGSAAMLKTYASRGVENIFKGDDKGFAKIFSSFGEKSDDLIGTMKTLTGEVSKLVTSIKAKEAN